MISKRQHRPLARFMAVFLSLIMLGDLSACKMRPQTSYIDDYIGSLPKQAPKNAVELSLFFVRRHPELLKPQVVTDVAQKLTNSVGYLADQSQIDRMSLLMFQQWLYLELYKVTRTEFLMMNFIKILILSNHSPNVVMAKYDQFLPGPMFENYIGLAQTHSRLRAELQSAVSNANVRNEIRQANLGMLEGAYMALKVIDMHREYTAKHFDSNDIRYQQTYAELDVWQSMINGHSSFLLTSAFEKNVTPYYASETAKAHELKERAINQFNSRFRAHVDNMRKLHDIMDFLVDENKFSTVDPGIGRGELQTLTFELMEAFKVQPQQTFRARITNNYYAAANEIISNLEKSLTTHLTHFIPVQIDNNILELNTKPAIESRQFTKWLAEVVREEPLHAVIREQYPYLKTGADAISDVVKLEVQSNSMSRLQWSAAVAGLFVIGGAFNAPQLSFIGPKLSFWIKSGILGANAALSAKLMYDAWRDYQNYKEIYRLARLSADGVSLTTVLQENFAYSSMLWSGSLAILQVTQTSMYGYKNFLQQREVPKFLKNVSSIAHHSWKGTELPWRYLKQSYNADIAALNLIADPTRKFVSRVSTMGMHAAYLSTRVLVGAPAAVLEGMYLKGFVSNMSPTAARVLIIGTSFSVLMGMTQSHIRPAVLTAVTTASEWAGINLPVSWKIAGRDDSQKAENDMQILLLKELNGVQRKFSNYIQNKNNLAKMLNDPEISVEQKASLQQQASELKKDIEDSFRLLIISWYHRVEFRSLSQEFYEKEGFSIVAFPNPSKPQRMIITYSDRSGSNLSYEITADQIKEIGSRNEMPHMFDEEEIKIISDSLSKN